MHIKTSLKAASYGKHILLEKPLSLKAKNIDPLIKSAKKNKVIIKEAFMVRHHPQWQWVKKYIKDGKTIAYTSAELFQNNKIVASATATSKLV